MTPDPRDPVQILLEALEKIGAPLIDNSLEGHDVAWDAGRKGVSRAGIAREALARYEAAAAKSEPVGPSMSQDEDDARLQRASDLLLTFMVEYPNVQTFGDEIDACINKHIKALAAALPREVSEETIQLYLGLRDIEWQKACANNGMEYSGAYIIGVERGLRWALEKARGDKDE